MLHLGSLSKFLDYLRNRPVTIDLGQRQSDVPNTAHVSCRPWFEILENLYFEYARPTSQKGLRAFNCLLARICTTIQVTLVLHVEAQFGV